MTSGEAPLTCHWRQQIEFGFRTSGHETGILDGIDMMSRKDAIKQIVSVSRDAGVPMIGAC